MKRAQKEVVAAAYGTEGKWDQAIWELDRALQIEPGLAVAYNNRGYIYYEKGNFDRAIADYSRALQINPRYLEATTAEGLVPGSKGIWNDPLPTLPALWRSTPTIQWQGLTRVSPVRKPGANSRPGRHIKISLDMPRINIPLKSYTLRKESGHYRGNL